MIFLGYKWHLNDTFWFKQYLNKIFWFKLYFRKRDKAAKLCLESFCSGNLAHFHLEQRKSNLNGMVHEQNRENQIWTDNYMNGTVRAKITISHMPQSISLPLNAFQVLTIAVEATCIRFRYSKLVIEIDSIVIKGGGSQRRETVWF